MELSKCPFCGQPLTNHAAVKHLHRSQAKFEADLRRVLLAEASARAEKEAEKRIEKEREAARVQAESEIASVRKRLDREQAKLSAFQSKVAAERAQNEKRIRGELERKQATRQRQLERTIESLQEHNKELERRIERLSAPERGELNEEEVFNRLVEAFPEDDIRRKGKGGDIVHIVRYSAERNLRRAGLILYECKDTLQWRNNFIEQIKRDGKTHRTPHLLLVTRTLPRGEKGMSVRDEVVVVDPPHVIYLAHVVRRMVVEADRAGLAGKGKATKTALLYEYLAGEEFREHFDAVIGAGEKLTAMLQQEKKAHERTWTRREQTYSELERKSAAIDESIRGIIEAEPRSKAIHEPDRRRPRKPRGAARRKAHASA